MSRSNPKDPCKISACRIQTCLKEHEFDETRCYDVLEDMRQCCLKWHKVSLCCSGIKLDRNYRLEKEALERENLEKQQQQKQWPTIPGGNLSFRNVAGRSVILAYSLAPWPPLLFWCSFPNHCTTHSSQTNRQWSGNSDRFELVPSKGGAIRANPQK